MSRRTSKQQKAFLLHIKWNPGCCAADLIASTLKTDSDSASSAHRSLRAMRRRGFIRSGPKDAYRAIDGRVRRGLYITDRGLEAIR